MASHRPPDLYPRPSSGGGGRGVPVPMRVDPPLRLSGPTSPGKLVVRPGVLPGLPGAPEMWAVPLAPPLYEFQGQAGPCGALVRVGEVGAGFPGPSDGALPGPCVVVRCLPRRALPEDGGGIGSVEKELGQLARELKLKRLTLGYSQADVGFAVGALFGKVLSQTTICRFEAQQLSLANMCKLRPLLKMWLEEVASENLPGLCRMEMILRQARKQRRASRERRLGNNLEKLFLQCPRPTPQQISSIAGQLRLQKDLVRVWFSKRSRMGSWPAEAFLPPEEVGAAPLPFPGGPVCFPLAPGLHLPSCPYGGAFFTPLYPSVPFPVGGNPAAPVPSLGLPRLSN
ncbi:POU domain, class 5, transcription factor 2 [Sorex fumeus]|uniref:POU domain, class 5, transcription factor 2 n=1 Tax=Sorex fumeus TaxID=62283 RepID=UPI0024AE6FBC|nr:POU domain, class 5, transcription factor 2 [Sorex fumeus]